MQIATGLFGNGTVASVPKTVKTKRKPKRISRAVGLNEQLDSFMRIANAMLEATDLDQILSAITREVARVVEFDRSSVAFQTKKSDRLVLRNIHKGSSREHFGEGREIPIDESTVIGWVATHKEPIVRRDIARDKQFKEIVSEESLRSDVIVPLLARERLLGTLNVGSHRPNAFSKHDVEVIVNCGKFASLAIEHTMLRLEAEALSRRYRTLQENANDMIFILDRNTSKLVEVNRKCESVLGYRQKDLVGRSYMSLFLEGDQDQARRDFIDILSRKSLSTVDRKMIGRDGTVIYVDVNANLIEIRGEFFVQMIIHNVSQRRMLEKQIISQNQYLQEVNKKLTQVDQMKTEFLANISHELRTPLSIIIAYSESLRDPSLPEEARTAFVDVISQNGQNLLALINNLLDLSKLEISGQMLNMSLSHVHDVIRSIWEQMKNKAVEKGIKISLDAGDGIPITYLDNNQMVSVFHCLIQNAIKFTDSGGNITVRTRFEDNEITITVADTGRGIREEELKGIFDTFHQIDGSSSRQWGGLGIGLALAKHIVELHRGRLEVESEYKKGSTFRVVLPLETEHVFLDEKRDSVDSGHAMATD